MSGIKYCDKTTKEWKKEVWFYYNEYKGYFTLPEFLGLHDIEWAKYEKQYSNPKDIGLKESDLPCPLGSRLFEIKSINNDLYVYPYIFGTNSIMYDLKRYQNRELFLDRNEAEKELENRLYENSKLKQVI